jgi:hypothetical protein
MVFGIVRPIQIEYSATVYPILPQARFLKSLDKYLSLNYSFTQQIRVFPPERFVYNCGQNLYGGKVRFPFCQRLCIIHIDSVAGSAHGKGGDVYRLGQVIDEAPKRIKIPKKKGGIK